jgi:hypothetical protein
MSEHHFSLAGWRLARARLMRFTRG